MKFRKLPDTIPIALFEANYSMLSPSEHLVLEAIGSTVVQGKGTELYELLVWFDFAFLYHLFSKPKHCSMNNCSSFYELLNPHTIPISFLSLQYCQDFCLSCNSLIHLHKPCPFVRAWVSLVQHATGNEWQKFSSLQSAKISRELPEYTISLSLFLQAFVLVYITVQVLYCQADSGSFTFSPDYYGTGWPGWDKAPRKNVTVKTFLKPVVLFGDTYLSQFLTKFRLWPRHIFSTHKCGKIDPFHCSGHIILKQSIIKIA